MPCGAVCPKRKKARGCAKQRKIVGDTTEVQLQARLEMRNFYHLSSNIHCPKGHCPSKAKLAVKITNTRLNFNSQMMKHFITSESAPSNGHDEEQLFDGDEELFDGIE